MTRINQNKTNSFVHDSTFHLFYISRFRKKPSNTKVTIKKKNSNAKVTKKKKNNKKTQMPKLPLNPFSLQRTFSILLAACLTCLFAYYYTSVKSTPIGYTIESLDLKELENLSAALQHEYEFGFVFFFANWNNEWEGESADVA